MKNQYKRQDIFLCTHDAHAQRGHHVSVYHTLHRKGCFPNGCTFFRWKCRELENRRKCYRGYTHVGRKCPGCKHFDEEKITRSLVPCDADTYAAFLEDLEAFEDWLRDNEGKEQWCLGHISSVKPNLKQLWYGGSARRPRVEHNRLLGYLICFDDLFIGNEHLEDFAFAIVGREFQKRLKFRTGDRVEFRARMTVEDGRLVFQHLHQITFSERGRETAVWTDSDSLVARANGTTLARQAEKCVACDRGWLIDVIDRTAHPESIHHRIFCTQGMKSAAVCDYNTSTDLYGHTCSNRFHQISLAHVHRSV